VTETLSPITIGSQHGNFELNTMLPLIAHNLLQSLAVEKTLLLVTALTPMIGYDCVAQIAKQAAADGRRIKDVAAE
jgi:fumarate hydratase class II